MSLLSFSKNVDRGSYEKLSIRDSARSLKKYGSTSSKTATKTENYIKHFVSNSDTLQGIALKYNVTIEQIRRANKLWASDSLFLREFLLIPHSNNANDLLSPIENQSASSQSSLASSSIENLNQNRMSVGSSTRSSFDEENINDFLNKIDASIASTKEVVKKVTNTSEYGSEFETDQKKRPQSRIKQQQYQQQNNNGPPHNATPMNTVVTVQQGGAAEEEEGSDQRRAGSMRGCEITYAWPQKKKLLDARAWGSWKSRVGSYRIAYDRF